MLLLLQMLAIIRDHRLKSSTAVASSLDIHYHVERDISSNNYMQAVLYYKLYTSTLILTSLHVTVIHIYTNLAEHQLAYRALLDRAQ